MLGENNSPFAAIAFEQIHRDGDPMAVIAIRGSFKLDSDGSLHIADKQAIVLADEYEGPAQTSQLVKVSDLVPFKPATDITVLGHAYAPEQYDTAWQFGVTIANKSYLLHCHGEREWIATKRDWQGISRGADPHAASGHHWQLTTTASLAQVPLDYALAAGGEVIGARRHEVDLRNPRGCGLLHPDLRTHGESFPAPAIDSESAPVESPFKAPEPQGTAPVPPWWAWRQRYVGTYDEIWKRERHPRLPEDFDYHFYQCAHPNLIWDGYLNGAERVQLHRLTADQPSLTFVLPDVVPVARFLWRDEREVVARLNLDGVYIDMRGEPPWQVDLTWRGWIVTCPQFLRIDIKLVRLGHPVLPDLPSIGEAGLEEAST
ncbi:DUF2169 domain-containing protein [Labrys okinawensis]|uniref:DUF2169 domain-containing protein n=1 Tax=Labrys okinawensis TaxID=346911 RepID=A0A2S9QF90_9HYPH|nr:DUF2169 domain-containing protein [Labrys okinawensis]PRH88011.1 DUF2169 domain-containing protein [Labrys okinawensis]